MLQDLGVQAVSAWSGEEALEKLMADRFDVVLMDCQMPKLDGYATTSRFRDWETEQQRPRTPHRGADRQCAGRGCREMLRRRHGPLPQQALHERTLFQVLESCFTDAAPPATPPASPRRPGHRYHARPGCARPDPRAASPRRPEPAGQGAGTVLIQLGRPSSMTLRAAAEPRMRKGCARRRMP